MSLIAAVRTGGSTDVLSRLRSVCDAQGMGDLAARLADLADLVRWDMGEIEQALGSLPEADDIVRKSGAHLLARGGKRLRPMCVALASRVGPQGDTDDARVASRELGVAVELVHCATLLHDDVIDLGEQRRGAPAARMLYGNAASVFAGDWLLIESLRRVRALALPDVLDRLLGIIDEMIRAEAIQLECRGRLDTRQETYFQVVEGKTAALFRWAMMAGGRAGGLDADACAALERYGLHLGVAFQLVDDYLDYAGDADVTGKALFADLREGKMTHPLLLALERRPAIRPTLEALVMAPEDEVPAPADQRLLLAALRETDALADCRALAQDHAMRAIDALSSLPKGRARAALHTVAEATVHREA